MYLITAVKDVYDAECGVEIAGLFDTKEKAYEAKEKVETWLENEGFEDFEVFIAMAEINMLRATK